LHWQRNTDTRYPFLVALGENGEVTVHSLLDQKEKQRLFFRGGRILCDTGGRFILASDNKISLLAPVSFQQQVRARDCACVRVWLCTHVLLHSPLVLLWICATSIQVGGFAF
jgi:hypothetical protein